MKLVKLDAESFAKLPDDAVVLWSDGNESDCSRKSSFVGPKGGFRQHYYHVIDPEKDKLKQQVRDLRKNLDFMSAFGGIREEFSRCDLKKVTEERDALRAEVAQLKEDQTKSLEAFKTIAMKPYNEFTPEGWRQDALRKCAFLRDAWSKQKQIIRSQQRSLDQNSIKIADLESDVAYLQKKLDNAAKTLQAQEENGQQLTAEELKTYKGLVRAVASDDSVDVFYWNPKRHAPYPGTSYFPAEGVEESPPPAPQNKFFGRGLSPENTWAESGSDPEIWFSVWTEGE